jgi:hypothetical protein
MPARAIEDLTSAQIAAELFNAVKGGDCIAWVGSGLSKGLYPDWLAAVSGLCTACAVQPFDDSRPSPTADELIDKAEECKQANAAAYEAALAGFYGGNVVPTRLAYLWLMRAPFKAYATTNFDPLLSETAAPLGYKDVYWHPTLPSRELERRNKPLFYLHGHARPNGIANGRDLVLSRSEFEIAYSGVVGLFVQNLLYNYPIVFIGCSLSEPEIHQQIRRVHSMHVQIKNEAQGFKAPSRFALLPTRFRWEAKDGLPATRERNRDAELEEANRFGELDTEVLRYDPADRMKHWEIEDILKLLCDLAEETPKVGRGEAMPR